MQVYDLILKVPFFSKISDGKSSKRIQIRVLRNEQYPKGKRTSVRRKKSSLPPLNRNDPDYLEKRRERNRENMRRARESMQMNPEQYETYKRKDRERKRRYWFFRDLGETLKLKEMEDEQEYEIINVHEPAKFDSAILNEPSKFEMVQRNVEILNVTDPLDEEDSYNDEDPFNGGVEKSIS